MTHPVSTYLIKHGRYTESQLTLLEQTLETRYFTKNEILLDKGEVCSIVYFIERGCVFQYTADEDAEITVINLHGSNEWSFNHHSFTSRKPSESVIKAREDTKTYSLTIEAIHGLIAQSQSFLQMGKILEEITSRLVYYDKLQTPDEKYLHLLETRPELIQKFPQKMIASYLKMTPETLSRVRGRIGK